MAQLLNLVVVLLDLGASWQGITMDRDAAHVQWKGRKSFRRRLSGNRAFKKQL